MVFPELSKDLFRYESIGFPTFVHWAPRSRQDFEEKAKRARHCSFTGILG
jgi:hypothetical protein